MTDQPDLDPADDTLPPSEATDSDELRNDDGDATVTAPDSWQPADDDPAGESLDDKLAAEEPEDTEDTATASGDAAGSWRHRGQVSGSPEDGDSFYNVEE